MIWRICILTFGTFCAATSVVMTKASQLQPEHLSAARLITAAIILCPLFIRDRKRFPEFSISDAFKISALPSILLAAHFIAWTIGARWTTAANSTLIVNMIPVAIPFMGYFILKERLNAKELAGPILAVLGISVLAVTDFRLDARLLAGDLVCVVSMLLLAWYLVLARKNKSIPSIWLYVVPLYLTASGISFFAGLVRTGLPYSTDPQEWIYILLLGLIPTAFGHSLLNLSMHWFRSQFVALMTQMQFVYAGVLGYWFFKELPSQSFYVAGAFMLTGVLWTILSHKEPNPSKRELT